MVLQINGQNLIKLLIPAAGKGTRTKLNYPKTLFKIDNKPIIMNIINTCKDFDKSPIIICSKSGYSKIRQTMTRYNINSELLIQYKRQGMADAVSKVINSNNYNKYKHFLVIWSDLIKPNKKTIQLLVKMHIKEKNDFSIATIKSHNCYTKVIRKKNKIIKIEELKNKKINYNGERDVGIFLINKNVIECLLANKKRLLNGKEYSFLKLVEVCVKKNLKVEAYKIATKQDLMSFNSYKDIECL